MLKFEQFPNSFIETQYGDRNNTGYYFMRASLSSKFSYNSFILRLSLMCKCHPIDSVDSDSQHHDRLIEDNKATDPR